MKIICQIFHIKTPDVSRRICKELVYKDLETIEYVKN